MPAPPIQLILLEMLIEIIPYMTLLFLLIYVGTFVFLVIAIPIGKIMVRMPASIDELYIAAEKTSLYLTNPKQDI
jgi:hypothetical protein